MEEHYKFCTESISVFGQSNFSISEDLMWLMNCRMHLFIRWCNHHPSLSGRSIVWLSARLLALGSNHMEKEPVRSLTLPLLAVLYQFTLVRNWGLEKGSMHLVHLLKTLLSLLTVVRCLFSLMLFLKSWLDFKVKFLLTDAFRKIILVLFFNACLHH